MATNSSSPDAIQSQPIITRIEIRKLFGQYNYDIEPRQGETPIPLLILYGDNGSGKTTILNLVCHILSPEPYEGHRTAIGATPFASLSVHLGDGHIIRAWREGTELTGSYDLAISLSGRTLSEYTWQPDRRTADMKGTDEEKTYMKFCSLLQKAGLTIHFLSDSRKVLSFQRPKARRREIFEERARLLQFHGEAFLEQEEESWLQTAIHNAVQSVRSMALAGTNRGYESANAIYNDIVARLVSYVGKDAPSSDTRQRLQERLHMLCERNSEYSRLGLTSELEINELEHTLGKASPESLAVVDRVLTPYLDGVQARLDALQDAQRLIAAFSSLLTQFYKEKTVRLHLSDGISVVTNAGQTLRPEDLSSGEQQLMLLMCNAISARGRATVFAIDEPELSLNVKWQRTLIDALVKCLEGTKSQLVLATHSIELLTKYRNYVVHLANIAEEATANA